MRLGYILTFCAALAALGTPRSGAARTTRMQGSAVVPVVVALGDSLTAGYGLAREQAYPVLLEQKARAVGLTHRFVNRGVSGDTTTGALRRLDAALEPGTMVLIVALGVNDGLRGVPIDTVRKNLSTIIERAQARAITVLLCAMDTPPAHGWGYTLEFHSLFPALAGRYRVPLVPFLLGGIFGQRELNLPDGVHPNAAGARRIADHLWPYVEPLLKNGR